MKGLSFAWEILKIILLALVIVLPIRYFVFQPFIVKGASMEPNFHEGDYLIVDELSYRFRDPHRGEVIVFNFPLDHSDRFIKRIIGLPTETVEIKQGQVAIIDKFGGVTELREESYLKILGFSDYTKLTLGAREYFVLGDNRVNSSDSRKWGVVKQDEVIGRVLIRAWPLNQLRLVGAPSY